MQRTTSHQIPTKERFMPPIATHRNGPNYLDDAERRSAHDVGSARRAPGPRGTRPARSGPTARPFAHPQRPCGCRPYFGAEAISAGDWQLHVAGETRGHQDRKVPSSGKGRAPSAAITASAPKSQRHPDGKRLRRPSSRLGPLPPLLLRRSHVCPGRRR